ncbi:hypothetical protein [Methanolapillus millepedarum]
MTKSGKFTSTSDIVSIALVFLIAERTRLNFDDSTIIENTPEDNSARPKISAALNEYLDSELENIAKETQKSKSYIVRVALFRFFEFYNNTEKVKRQAELIAGPEEKYAVSKREMKKIVRDIVPEIVDEYLNSKFNNK